MNPDVKMVLRRAFQRVKHNGWRQGVQPAKTFIGWTLKEAIIHKNNEPLAVDAAIELVKQEIGFAFPGFDDGTGDLLDKWNEAPGRTPRDILKLLSIAMANGKASEKSENDLAMPEPAIGIPMTETELMWQGVAEEGTSFLLPSTSPASSLMGTTDPFPEIELGDEGERMP